MTRILMTLIVAALLVSTVVAQDSQPAQDDDAKSAAAELAYALMSTNKGDIVLELDSENAPISTKNFMQYVEDKYYDGTIFHRVIPNFMIQGGGFNADMQKKDTRDPIKNEWRNGLKNDRGTIAMARTRVADSATSQFFINVKDNPALDSPRDGAAYAVFGKVIAGMEVVDEIRYMPTKREGQHANVPVESVIIKTVRAISKDEAMKAKSKKPAPSTQPSR